MGQPFETMIWIARIEGLKAHLRIILSDCANSENSQVQRIGRQAQAGIIEADRYIADNEWGDEDN